MLPLEGVQYEPGDELTVPWRRSTLEVHVVRDYGVHGLHVKPIYEDYGDPFVVTDRSSITRTANEDDQD